MRCYPLARWFGISFVLCALISAPVAAQQKAPEEPQKKPPSRRSGTANYAIAVIDLQAVIRASTARKSMQPQIEKLAISYREKLKRLEEEWQKIDKDLLRQRAILSPEAYDQRRTELRKKFSQAQRALQERKQAIDKTVNESLAKIQQVLLEVTKEIAVERSIGIVLSKPAVFLSAKRLSISGVALARLNKRLPSVNVTLPEKK